MNELMQHLFAHINDQTIVRQASESARLTPEEASYESPYGDIIANLFNNEVSVGSFCILNILPRWSLFIPR